MAEKWRQEDEAGCSTPPLSTNFPDSVWTWLLKDAETFARKQIQQYRWRAARGGVLPGGYDANSIAAEAIAELLECSEPKTARSPVAQTFLSAGSGDFPVPSPPQTTAPETPVTPHPGKPAFQTTNMPKGWELQCLELQKDLHQRVRRQVNRLWHLKENEDMRNLEDLDRVPTGDGETMTFLESLPAPDPSPAESLIEQEEMASQQQLQEQFQAFLGNQGALQSLYACLCSGISTRQDLARKLKVTTPEVKNRLSRLRRRAAAFLQLDRSERMKKGVKNCTMARQRFRVNLWLRVNPF